ncbi:MAG: PEP-CTERM sorting domain-containing protein [Desulfobacterales bacterium]|nr:PEP-CTERM sorting domain-containing protein [Desulfobacterales bacterium]
MKKLQIIFLSVLFLGLSLMPASAVTISLYDWAFKIDETLTVAPAEYDTSGMPVDITGGALIGDLGELTWKTYEAGPHNFIAFFDYEIDEAINTFFNEYGTAIDSPKIKQSWEIDDPCFGDIYAHVLAGVLDNTNAVPEGSKDDVSWAMGWEFFLNPGDWAEIFINLSYEVPDSGFYLAQTDPDSDATIYFSSELKIHPIPEPCTVMLFGTGILGLIGFTRKNLSKRHRNK